MEESLSHHSGEALLNERPEHRLTEIQGADLYDCQEHISKSNIPRPSDRVPCLRTGRPGSSRSFASVYGTGDRHPKSKESQIRALEKADRASDPAVSGDLPYQ